MATWYIDPQNGGAGSAGTSFATRRKSVTGLSMSAGDTVRFIKSGDLTSVGTASWVDGLDYIQLNTPVNKNICMCESSWTVSAGGTSANTDPNRKEGNSSVSFLGPGAGEVARKTVDGGVALDLSSYQQISFWIYPNTAFSSGAISIKLYDSGGILRNTLTINEALVAGSWIPITIDNGSALNADVLTIALECSTTFGSGCMLDDVIACTAPSSANSLNLNSLITKNNGDGLFAIGAINNDKVYLDFDPIYSRSNTLKAPYSGTTESATMYKLEPLLTTLLAYLSTTRVNDLPTSGSAGSPITYSGGWNSTDMSTQTGSTVISGRTGGGIGFYSTKDYIAWERLGAVRYYTAFDLEGNNNSGSLICANNNTLSGVALTVGSDDYNFSQITSLQYNSSYGLDYDFAKRITIDYLPNVRCNRTMGISTNHPCLFFNCASGMVLARNDPTGSNNYQFALYGGGIIGPTSIFTSTSNGHGGLFLSPSHELTFKSLSITNDNTVAFNAISIDTPQSIVNILNLSASGFTNMLSYTNANFTFNTNVTNAINNCTNFYSGGQNYSNYRINSNNEGGTPGNNVIRTDGATITSQTAVRHGSSGLGWKTLISSSTIRNSLNPVRFSFAKVAFNASTQVTFSAWVLRNSASAVNSRIVIYGGSVDGVSNDIYATSTAADNTFEQLTLTFTPTVAGVAEVFIETSANSGSTNYSVVSDISVSQL